MNIKTIKYWHKLEHFYPYILEEQRDKNIKTFYIKDARDFPDYCNQHDMPENMQVRYYEIYLGIFKVDSALKVLAGKLQAQKEFHDESDETSCFCKIRVEADGTFNKEKFKISSFPWAIQRVNDNKIYLEKWDEDFQIFQREFFLRFFECHKILTYEVLKGILEEIRNSIDWKIEFETCWMRIDRVIGEQTTGARVQNVGDSNEEVSNLKTEEEIQLDNKRVDELIKANDLLNSFYVRDLERVIAQVNEKNFGPALNLFVEHENSKRIDVESDKEVLLEIFNPKNMPLGKWPSGFGLRAMQQVSVNLAQGKELNVDNVFSVNGPPGTGKTTLLRDIIAANEVERAIQLLSLETPDEAFDDTIGIVNYNNFKTEIRPLKPEFAKYGILIASNNNTAVTNISEELPLKASLSIKYQENYRYFSEVSDRLLQKDTWGILSAALGNYSNKTKFLNNFWPVFEDKKETFKFHNYLKEQLSKNKNSYRQNWKDAKEKFINVYIQVQELYTEMNRCYERIIKENTDKAELEKILLCIRNKSKEKGDIEEEINEYKKQVVNLEKEISRKDMQKTEIKQHVSFFWIKYIFTKSLDNYKQLEKEIMVIISDKAELEEKIDELQSDAERLGEERRRLENTRDDINTVICEHKKFIKEWSDTYNSVVPDDIYLSKLICEDKEVKYDTQIVSPWNGEKIINLREQIYLEAVNLHRVFIENSPQMYKQLDMFYKIVRDKISKEEAIKYATPVIQAFQLAVPVISSTFASVGNFLKYAGRNTFGLLLIDEAGQALPQSAVGAIWRSGRCIVVGDPLQIEPVVTIHDKTIQFLKLYFEQSDFIASKETSVQSLADGCSQFGGWRNYDDGEKWIGSPLLVHGRCQRKIFDIANKIAYNEKMIYGTKDSECAQCRWLHISGKATNKHYVPEQAHAILPEIITAFYEAWKEGKEAPSLFIISPFRSVKSGIRNYLDNGDYLYRHLISTNDVEKKRVIRDWIYNNIGTIHTFQGKEAEKVIICLGVDSDDSGYGAIQWASQKPNILNVAATRAKKQLCIVGDKNKWANQPYFQVAYDICTQEES